MYTSRLYTFRVYYAMPHPEYQDYCVMHHLNTHCRGDEYVYNSYSTSKCIYIYMYISIHDCAIHQKNVCNPPATPIYDKHETTTPHHPASLSYTPRCDSRRGRASGFGLAAWFGVGIHVYFRTQP